MRQKFTDFDVVTIIVIIGFIIGIFYLNTL
jgi:hypothetical protein